MPACPPAVREQLEAPASTVELVDVSEFHKGGGSVRCLTNPLDVTLGRDLRARPRWTGRCCLRLTAARRHRGGHYSDST